jgi:uncharacterized protein (DUF433 family)
MSNPAPFEIVAEAPPLAWWDDGSVRVGGTRLTLDIVVEMFLTGASPEYIAWSYPPLTVAEAYAVVAFYLRHRDAVDAYLEEGERHAEATRRKWETLHPSDGLRERLLQRLAERDAAASG